MLDRILAGVKVAALVAVTFLCVSLGVAVLSIRADVRMTTQQINQATTQFTATTQQVAAEIVRDADRLTTRADRLMIVAGATATQAHLAAKSQRLFWEKETPQMVARVNKLLDQGDRFMDNGNRLLVTTDVAMLDLRDGITQLRRNTDQVTAAALDLTAESTQTIKTFRDLAGDPDLLTIKGNLARMSEAGAQMSEDTAYKLHRFAHPEDLKGKDKVWHYTIAGVRALGDALRLIYFWP